jgi:hypothetical protein
MFRKGNISNFLQSAIIYVQFELSVQFAPEINLRRLASPQNSSTRDLQSMFGSSAQPGPGKGPVYGRAHPIVTTGCKAEALANNYTGPCSILNRSFLYLPPHSMPNSASIPSAITVIARLITYFY